MAYEEMGYQLRLYIGTAGTTAGTQVTQATDIDYDVATTKGSTTARGTGGAPPIHTENVTERAVTVTWKQLNDPTNDTTLATLISKAIVGDPLSIKLTTGSGATLLDCDVTLTKKYNAPIGAEGSYDFTATPTKQSGRTPTIG